MRARANEGAEPTACSVVAHRHSLCPLSAVTLFLRTLVLLATTNASLVSCFLSQFLRFSAVCVYDLQPFLSFSLSLSLSASGGVLFTAWNFYLYSKGEPKAMPLETDRETDSDKEQGL